MIVTCSTCSRSFEDEVRWTVCPHETRNFPYPETHLAGTPVGNRAGQGIANPEKGTYRRIQPLGGQLIIRTFPPDQIGSIIVPDSAKGITKMGAAEQRTVTDYLISADILDAMVRSLNGSSDRKDKRDLLDRIERAKKVPVRNDTGNAVHFVEAEVIAVGPGKRVKDLTLFGDVLEMLRLWLQSYKGTLPYNTPDITAETKMLLHRSNHPIHQPLTVKPGDRILYHPAVQRFDRKIEPQLIGLESGECYIIREESVLAILELSEEEKQERSANQTASTAA